MRSITSASRTAALKGWETRKANEASRARRVDEVIAENRKMRAVMRRLLDQLKLTVVNSSTPIYREAEGLLEVRS